MANSTTQDGVQVADIDTDASDAEAVARLSHHLHGSDAFRATMEAAAATYIQQALGMGVAGIDAEAIDQQAIDVLAALAAREAQSGPFFVRNEIVTVGSADLQAGDTIHMDSAQDPEKVIDYRIVEADPEATEVDVIRTAHLSHRAAPEFSFGAGQVLLSDRFRVDRHRDSDDGQGDQHREEQPVAPEAQR